MSSGFSQKDRDSFFETEGVAVQALITGPAVTPPAVQFTKTIPVIFTLDGEGVDLYADTEVAAENPSFLCKTSDLLDVKRDYTVTFPDLEAHEDGFEKTYQITPRILREGVQTSRVYLKEL